MVKWFPMASVGSLLDRAPQVNVMMIKVVWSPGTEIKRALTLFAKYTSNAARGCEFIVVKQ